MIDLILNEPQLLFSLALTAKTCLVALAGFIAGLPLVVRPLHGGVRLAAPHRTRGGRPHPRREQARRLPQGHAPARSAESRGGAPSRQRRVSGEVGITMMLGGNISERTNTLSLEIFNAVSMRRLRRRERALPPALALGDRHLPCGRAPHQAQPKALTSNARVTRGTLRLDSSGMADRVKWKDYPILLNYPP